MTAVGQMPDGFNQQEDHRSVCWCRSIGVALVGVEMGEREVSGGKRRCCYAFPFLLLNLTLATSSSTQ